ncbi:MBL fold metallo-hydrolase [Actinomadura decatromicini]|uniref:Ribonuclease Z n=1 Tax=Actinomadura decatromicini TaxID=2604572 RepID=A0A5D3F4Z2_9ACTN|nr:MBL fold metallo-hydrolase [Actinomadura decatromicini]TYK43129.1 ribonuclease Z [Actinomadura decatromicini]
MKLQFVGTGSILTARMSASALIDGKVLIDAPNGSMKAMRRVGLDPSAVDICVITHFHADHFFDIVFLLLEQGLQHTRDRDLVLIGPEGFSGRVDQLFELSYPGVWKDIKGKVSPRYIEFGEEGGECSEGGYEFRALPMKHAVPTLGYLITDKAGARLGYTGDTVHCPSVDTLAAESSVLVLDTSFLKGRVGHMGLDDVEAIATQRPELHLIATHLGDEVTRSSRPNIVFPVDGQSFDITPQGLQIGAPPAKNERPDHSTLGLPL